jgi:tRNA(Ile)-lysidine synthase
MPEPRAVSTLIDKMRASIARRGMLKGGEIVVVAVSGGPDSLALLHSLVRLAPELDLTLHVAHFDHRLREGSASDAAFVGRVAAKLGLAATARAAGTSDTPKGLSPEEIARERRYAFLEEVADAVGATRIATGHTLDDQAETVLMRAISGTGMRGLGGIRPLRGRVVRPMIDVRRSETEAFCRALRLKPRVDPTNADARFLRNAVRAELLPIIEGRFNARAVEALGRLADLARDDDALLEELAMSALPLEPVEGGWRIEVDALLRLDPALQRRVVRAAARLDSVDVRRVLELARTGSSGDAIDLPAPLKAWLEYGSLVVGRAPSRPDVASPIALAVPGVTELSPWGLQMRAWIGTREPSGWPDGRLATVLDADRAGASLAIRRPHAGDRFRPLGMQGAKKLSDFFIDEKVTRAAREQTAVVTNGEVIVWVVGNRLDDRVKVTDATTRYLWLEATAVSGETERGGE